MALNAVELRILLKLVERLKDRKPRILLLSYPDMLMTPESLELAGVPLSWDGLPKRTDDLSRTWADHGRPHLSHLQMIDPKSLFASLGAQVIVSDAFQWGHTDVVVDFNVALNWLTRRKLGTFDLIVDSCTPCHCFNVGMAFQNIDRLLAPGGFVYHQAPAAFPNHGFYSISPTTFFDWYQGLAYELGKAYRFAASLDKDGLVPTLAEVPPFGVWLEGMPSTCIYTFRKLDKRPHRFPVQRNYSALSREIPVTDFSI